MFNMKKKILKPADYTVILCSAGIVVYLFMHNFFLAPAGKQVRITGMSGVLEYSLNDDRTIEVEGPLGTETVIIRDGKVWVSDSPCPEKICIKMGKKWRSGEQIVCVPNRVVIDILGENRSFDAIAR